MQTVISNTSVTSTIKLIKEKYNQLSDDGCFFAIVRNEYDNKGNVKHDFFEVISSAISEGYDYVNTIVYPSSECQQTCIIDNTKYVVWICKNHLKMKFKKDTIREKHIWKDVEWGKREKNYNPKGKDPGNVWIPTEDDGKANIINHILLDDSGVISRLLDMSDCGNDYELINAPHPISNIKNTRKSSITHRYKNSYKVIFKSSENMIDIEDSSVKLIVTSPPYWNLKDYFKEGQIGQENYQTYLGRMKTVWEECYHKLSKDGSLWININIRVQNGKIIPIPFDFINMCKEIGFFYKGIIIWHKSSGIPTGDKNLVDHHEYVLVFTKSETYSVDFTTLSGYSDYKNNKINGASFWNINRKAGSVGKKYIHPAIYPNELVNRIIRVSSNPGDLIMDPFLGSGTSLISAFENSRSFVGYEYNEGFKDLMLSRFTSEIPDATISFSN